MRPGSIPGVDTHGFEGLVHVRGWDGKLEIIRLAIIPATLALVADVGPAAAL